MRTLSKHQLPGAIGAVIGLAIVAVLASGSTPTDSDAMQQLLLTGENLGLGVVEFLTLGFLLGLGAFGLRQLAVHINDTRLSSRPVDALGDAAMSATNAPIMRLPDVTAAGFEAAANTAFAPVTSLTEAQVHRKLAERKREERRSTLKGA